MNKRKNFHSDYPSPNTISRLKLFFLYPERKMVSLYRATQYYMTSKNFFMKGLYALKWLHARKLGYQISIDAKIGQGLKFLHNGLRIIVKDACIGEHCTIGVNVVIGYSFNQTTNLYSAPKIGNYVYIGHNSTIVGEISIGNNVCIAPNTFVNQNVPDNSLVIGNNIIIHKENASKPYLDL